MLASPHKVEVDPVLEHPKPISLESRLLALVGYINYGPEGVDTPLPPCVHIASAEPHAHRYIVRVFNRQPVQLGVLVHHFADYLKLIIGVTLDIGLQGFLHDDLIV